MKIAIIGGGAAGMMAAATIAEKNSKDEVVLIEKNTRLGRKVVISGGGRCNLTTSTKDIKELLKNYPRGAKWLRYSMHEFGPQETYKWFEDNGIPLKTEGKRVFPKSDKGIDVVYAFTTIFSDNNVLVKYSKAVEEIEKVGTKFVLTLPENQLIEVDKVILTTGGSAYSETGSTGDGYYFAKSLGHSVTQLSPSLTSFMSKEKWTHNLAGVSIEKVKLKIAAPSKYEFEGPILFTHKGITGPAVFAISALSAHEKTPLTLFIDLVPDKDYDSVKNEISKDPHISISKAVAKYIPKSFTKELLKSIQIDPTKKIREIGKKDINRISESLKNLQITLASRTPGNEMVTAGGVDLKEIDEKTMQSKICPGLYFAGEILDTDGFTGGYNLQNAWSTGRAAGNSAINDR
ncbi:NAD(P)/FAD-dependent oxidoreductase [Candidatus Peregrinibacteria bacterium]|jgi:predicted Rossmann fold flavoprotein|nr:NAD(P)/FAD-dependent oxidoreductase [Candidatus Peregrinibacteria bacterium]MBT7736861.1 NAD(P)/FAD-dependent oxidoreductase [Candidatus Peregrinibacteria bacterium]